MNSIWSKLLKLVGSLGLSDWVAVAAAGAALASALFSYRTYRTAKDSLSLAFVMTGRRAKSHVFSHVMRAQAGIQ
jgi:hypothetical protein